MAAVAYTGSFHGLNQATIQDAFHFDTNQFLIPVEGECPPLDYDDLFSMLNQPPVAQGSAGSSGEVPVPSVDSGFWEVSPAPPQTDARQPAAQQSEPKQSKTARDVASKRTRDTGGNKNKQNQLKELEALAAEKSQHLERLLHENNELKFRSQVLEKVVQMRDYQLKVMRGAPEDLPQFWGMPQQQRQQPADAADGGCGVASSSSPSGGACSMPGAAANGTPPSAVMTVKMASCGCLLGQSPVTLTEADRKRFRAVTKTQLLEGWKHFLSEVAVPLLALEANGEDEAAAGRIRQLAAEAGHLMKYSAMLAPDTFMVAAQTHLETDALASTDAGHWRSVVRTLDLTPAQIRELRAVWHLFRGIMDGILAERKGINERLSNGLHGPAADIHTAMAQLTVSPECEVIQALQRSMRREKTAHLLIRGYLYGRTLSVLQFVKAAVYSYPWMPNATAIVATVVEAGDALDGAY